MGEHSKGGRSKGPGGGFGRSGGGHTGKGGSHAGKSGCMVLVVGVLVTLGASSEIVRWLS